MSSDGGRLPGRPVLLLGLDGLGFPFLNSPLVSECAPNLRALLARSAVGPLASTFPPYTGPAWTSITTGVNPGRHGVFGFTDAAGRPVSDATVSAARIWDYVGQVGGRSVVINVPITYPPRPIEGVLVSGMPTPPNTPFCWPPELASDIEQLDYVIDVAVQEGSPEKANTLDRLRRMTEARGQAAARLARREPWDLFAVVFVLPDRLGHPWWKHLVPGHHLYKTRRAARLRSAAAEALRALDHAIADLLSTMPPATAVVLCSDHGFGPLRADLFFDVALVRAGIHEGARHGPARQALAALGRSPLATLAPQWLYEWARSVASRSGSRSDSSGLRRAWTAPPYESGVRLAEHDDHELRAVVTDLLVGLRGPDGAQLLRAVTPREELYSGPYIAEAPDLLCEMADESIDLHDGLHATQPWVSRDSLAWGTHTAEGVIAISGVEAGTQLHGQAPDVAATVLDLLGINVADLDGRSLVDTNSTARRVAASRSLPDREAGDVYSQEEEAAVMEHLRSLGYVD
ncbi:MAG: alkaline phosphatase family protein [Egibacteraceae bacterium]